MLHVVWCGCACDRGYRKEDHRKRPLNPSTSSAQRLKVSFRAKQKKKLPAIHIHLPLCFGTDTCTKRRQGRGGREGGAIWYPIPSTTQPAVASE